MRAGGGHLRDQQKGTRGLWHVPREPQRRAAPAHSQFPWQAEGLEGTKGTSGLHVPGLRAAHEELPGPLSPGCEEADGSMLGWGLLLPWGSSLRVTTTGVWPVRDTTRVLQSQEAAGPRGRRRPFPTWKSVSQPFPTKARWGGP